MNEQKVKSKKRLIITLIIIIIALLTLGGYLIYDKMTRENNKIINETKDEEKAIGKIDPTKDWTYDANYFNTTTTQSYETSYGETYSVSDIVVPYININSTDVAKINKKIKKTYDELINRFEQGLEDNSTYGTSSYKTYINGDILSVVITKTYGGTDIPLLPYDTYNINLKTLKSISYEEAYTNVSFTKETVNEKVKEAITIYMNMYESDMWNSENTLSTYLDKTINNYHSSLDDNSIQFFIDEFKTLNVIVHIELPEEKGQYDKLIIE